jgi:hypothetical protein
VALVLTVWLSTSNLPRIPDAVQLFYLQKNACSNNHTVKKVIKGTQEMIGRILRLLMRYNQV